MINYLLSLRNGDAYVLCIFLLLLTFMVAGLSGVINYFNVNSGFGAKELGISVAMLLISVALMVLFLVFAFIP